MRRPRPWKRALVWLACLGPFFYATYGLANYLATQRASVDSIVFAWEHFIPFWPWTIYPYWTINAFYALSLLLAPTRHVLDRHALRLLTAQIIAIGCFLLWPLGFSFGQPAVAGAPAFLFDALRGFDKPFNQAPSLHIALAVILWDFYRRLLASRWARVVLHLWTAAICLSVLTTFQHHFIDIPTGFLLGTLCVWLWPLEPLLALAQSWRIAVARRWKIAAFYFFGVIVFGFIATWGYSNGNAWLLWLWWPAVSLLLVACAYAFAGERSFAVDTRGRMQWSARWLLAPYRLAARGNTALWTARIAQACEVVPGVWLGGLPTKAAWHANGQRRLVSFCGELQPPKHAVAQCLPLLDMTVPLPRQLVKASALIDRAYAQAQAGNESLQVCCALGFSRSAAALACWLVRSGRSPNIDAAVVQIRRARPQIVLSAPWLSALRIATHSTESAS